LLRGRLNTEIEALYRAMQRSPGDVPFHGFEMFVEADGSYHFDFWSGRPRMMKGEYDENREKRLNNYLDYYLNEQASS
jgi:hypothetical protein